MTMDGEVRQSYRSRWLFPYDDVICRLCRRPVDRDIYCGQHTVVEKYLKSHLFIALYAGYFDDAWP